MAELTQKKLQAFSLVESIVSLTLISVTVGICFLLFNQVAINDQTKQKAKLLTENYWLLLEQGLVSSEQEYFDKDGLSFDIQFSPYNEIDQLYFVKIKASQQDQLIYTTQKLVILDEN